MLKFRYKKLYCERVLNNMEEKINLIKSKLTGDIDVDIQFLNSMYNAQNIILEETQATIEAINIVYNELTKEENEVEETEEKETIEENVENAQEQVEDAAQEESQIDDEEKNEIDSMIDNLIENIDKESTEEALKDAEQIIPKIEALSKTSDENVLYCSFSSDFEKLLFTDIFAGEKEVIVTPYANDIIYIIYADLLLKKKRKKAAIDALDRAIYWNYLNREARIKKIDILLSRQEVVKALEVLNNLLNISYTSADIAKCYAKYGEIFSSLRDPKSAYALYRISLSYLDDENVSNIVNEFEQKDSSLKEMSTDAILGIAEDNEITLGPNSNIIKAHRNITNKLIENGALEEAKMMLSNDYSMTRNPEIAELFNQLDQIINSQEQSDKPKEEKETKKKASTTKKKTTTKKATSKEK